MQIFLLIVIQVWYDITRRLVLKNNLSPKIYLPFKVLSPDSHGFDKDKDDIGCDANE
jgi:hypothetical protein